MLGKFQEVFFKYLNKNIQIILSDWERKEDFRGFFLMDMLHCTYYVISSFRAP